MSRSSRAAARDGAPTRGTKWGPARVTPWGTVLVIALGAVVFTALCALGGGPTVRDDHVTLYSAWMMVHGSVACAYRVPVPTRDYPLTAPLFTLLNALLQIVTGLGASHPFPSHAVALHGCGEDYSAVNSWLRGTTIARRSLWLGVAVWPLLAGAVVGVIRVVRGQRTVLEWWAIAVLALWPVYQLPFWEYYHPQDLLALAGVLAALASSASGRYALAATCATLAFLSQQNVVLALIVVALTLPTRIAWRRYVVAGALTGLLVVTPLVLAAGAGALRAAVSGTGLYDNPVYSTWMGQLGIYGHHALVISRGGPLVMGLLLIWWWRTRMKVPNVIQALEIMALLFSVRLVLEENLWSYYSVGIVTCWLLSDALARRRRWAPWVWSLGVSALPWLAALPLLRSTPLASASVWIWQLVFLPTALVISLGPLRALQRRRSDSQPDTARV